MGENRRGVYAVAACLVVLCLPGLAGAQAPDNAPRIPTPIRDTGVRGNPAAPVARGAIGAPGVVIRYEESASTGVVYHEESGGMLSAIAQPVKAAPKAPPAAPAPPAAAPKK